MPPSAVPVLMQTHAGISAQQAHPVALSTCSHTSTTTAHATAPSGCARMQAARVRAREPPGHATYLRERGRGGNLKQQARGRRLAQEHLQPALRRLAHGVVGLQELRHGALQLLHLAGTSGAG